MKIEGTCPNCKHDVSIPIDKLEVAQPQPVELLNATATPAATVQVTRESVQPPQPEVKIKTVAARDQPFYRCKKCNDKHKNENYKVRPNLRCPNCGTLNGEKSCKTCAKKTDPEDWEELDDETLDELEIPKPEASHTHED